MSGNGPMPPSWWHFWQFAWRIRTISRLKVTGPAADPLGGRTLGFLSEATAAELPWPRSNAAARIPADRRIPPEDPARMKEDHTTQARRTSAAEDRSPSPRPGRPSPRGDAVSFFETRGSTLTSSYRKAIRMGELWISSLAATPA